MRIITLSLLATAVALSAQADNYQHFIMYGQSLSTGHQSWPVVSTDNVPGNYMIGKQIWYNYGNNDRNSITPLKGTVAADFANQPHTKGVYVALVSTAAGLLSQKVVVR